MYTQLLASSALSTFRIGMPTPKQKSIMFLSSFIGVNILDPLTAKNVQLAVVLGLNRLFRSAQSLDLRGG
jgi:hypothetical protein